MGNMMKENRPLQREVHRDRHIELGENPFFPLEWQVLRFTVGIVENNNKWN